MYLATHTISMYICKFIKKKNNTENLTVEQKKS